MLTREAGMIIGKGGYRVSFLRLALISMASVEWVSDGIFACQADRTLLL